MRLTRQSHRLMATWVVQLDTTLSPNHWIRRGFTSRGDTLSITVRVSGLYSVSDLRVRWTQNECVCIPTATSDSEWQWEYKRTSFVSILRTDLDRNTKPNSRGHATVSLIVGCDDGQTECATRHLSRSRGRLGSRAIEIQCSFFPESSDDNGMHQVVADLVTVVLSSPLPTL